jgi:serine protease Do
LPSIADVVEKVYPSVVAINTEVVTMDIFRTPRTQKGAGSGWIIDKDGIIVTNNHVVEGAQKVTVELSDGRIFETDPQSIRTDPVTDLAVIKINATNLPAASVGNSKRLRVGDWVIAMGNPLGQGIRAKEGTVSGLNVSLDVDQNETLGDLIETSAAINPGNSGGPLVNMQAEVIGITSAKIAAVGVEGLGYAISTNTAIPIIQQLIKQGYVTRPWLGVTLYTVDQYIAAANGLSIDKGAVVAYVKPGSPASAVGLQQLDVITRFKDKEVTTAEEVINAIHDSQIGEEVKITFVRGNETKTTSARLIQSPPPGS